MKMDGFDGPLDLLIHLIKKDKVDIFDIAIADITHDYLEQIKKWQELDLEIASEFVVMAARLLEIKAKSLLPGTISEEEDLEIKLLSQLMEYQIFKEISEYLKDREAYELMAIYKDPEYMEKDKDQKALIIDPVSLALAFRKIIAVKEIKEVPVAHKIVRELFSIDEKIDQIMEVLKEGGEEGLSFKDLLEDGISREEVVVTFLALLELVKTQGIKIFQERVFEDFSIKREDVNG